MNPIIAPRAQAGLTLIELCFVVLLIVIVACIAIPSFQSLLERQRHAATLRALTVHLDYARLQGVQRGQNVRICPVAADGLCGNDWSRGWQILDAEDHVLLNAPLANLKHRLLWSMPGPAGIIYQSNGTTQMGNGTFVLCAANGDPQWVLVLNRQGRLRQRALEARDRASCGRTSSQV